LVLVLLLMIDFVCLLCVVLYERERAFVEGAGRLNPPCGSLARSLRQRKTTTTTTTMRGS